MAALALTAAIFSCLVYGDYGAASNVSGTAPHISSKSASACPSTTPGTSDSNGFTLSTTCTRAFGGTKVTVTPSKAENQPFPRIITDVQFGTATVPVSGTADSPVTLIAPRGPTGTVDVTIHYTVNGDPESATLTKAFTYATPFTTTFDLSGGTGPQPPAQATDGLSLVTRPSDPTRPGYTFAGWYVGTSKTPFDFSAPPASNTTLTAHWNGVSAKHTRGPDAGGTRVAVTADNSTAFTTIKAASGHTVALDAQGNAWGWGNNNAGWLGTGETKSTGEPASSTTPKQAITPANTRFTTLSTGTWHTVALDAAGNAWSWGYNAQGQIGNATACTDSTCPTPVPTTMPTDGTKFTQVNAGAWHTAALDTNGNAWSWGYNGNGQIGNGNRQEQTAPVPVTMPKDGTKFVAVSAGKYQTMALDADGNTWGWGLNSSGQIGNNSISTHNTPYPTKMPTGTTFTRISSGDSHTAALDSEGNVWTWGSDADGQLGDGGDQNRSTPYRVQVPAGTTFTSVTAGSSHTEAVDTNGTIWTWGGGNAQPVKVTPPLGSTTLTHIATGDDHISALDSSGNAWGWGSNNYGQLGNDSKTDSTAPVQAKLPEVQVTAISFDGKPGSTPYHAQDGTWTTQTPDHTAGTVDITVSYTLGGNPQTDAILPGAYTYLPSRTVTFSTDGGSTPPDQQSVQYEGLAKRPADPAKAGCIFAGWYNGDTPFDFTAPLTDNVTLTAKWGTPTLSPSKGRDTGNQTVSITLPKSTAFTTIKTAKDRTLALDANGNAWSWGNNNHGQLGTGETTTKKPASTRTPKQVKAPAGTQFTSISAGAYQSVALDTNGNAWGWGDNSFDELGNPDNGCTNYMCPTPIRTTMPTDGTKFMQINAGKYQTVALDTEGNAWGWGYNGNGELGIGKITTPRSLQPTPKQAQMPENTKFVTVSTSDNHTVAIDELGNIWGWGNDSNGELGDAHSHGSHSYTPIPVQMPADTTFTRISAGAKHTAAIDAKGDVWTWGGNDEGQIGNGTTTNQLTPVDVTPAGVTFTEVAAGAHHTMAIDTEGNIWVWGTTEGTTHPTPTKVLTPPTDIAAYTHLAAGDGHAGALDSEGNAWCWGTNTYGQLGNDKTEDSDAPVQATVPAPQLTTVGFDTKTDNAPVHATDGTWTATTPKHAAGAVDVTLTYTLGNNVQPTATLPDAFTYTPTYKISFDTSGGSTSPDEQIVDSWQTISRPVNPTWAGHTFEGWYQNTGQPFDFSAPVTANTTLTAHWGQPAISPSRGPDSGNNTATLTVPDTTAFSTIKAANAHTVALDAKGNAWGWGSNLVGMLGNGTGSSTTTPTMVKMPANTRFSGISAGTYHTVALDTSGNAWGWGYNNSGQLGNDKSTDSNVPVAVTMPNNTTFTQVNAGTYHTVALDTSGNAWGWGYNGNGQLGNSSHDNSAAPSPVEMPNNGTTKFVTISTGDHHTMALDDEGHAWGWGYNQQGQIGNQSNTDSTTPVMAYAPSTFFTRISTGADYTAALDSEGNAWTWGKNSNGQIGDGGTGSHNQPYKVSAPAGTSFTSIAAGTTHTVALDTAGNVWVWGGTDGSAGSTPTKINARGTVFTHIAAGDTHTVALDAKGDAWSWGGNTSGQFGNGTKDDSSSPVRTEMPTPQITAVNFGGSAGGAPTRNADGTWSLKVPAHQAGTADIDVAYSIGGNTQPTITLTSAYDYYLTTAELPFTGGKKSILPILMAVAFLLLIGAAVLSGIKNKMSATGR